MLDVILLALGLGFFALSVAYASAATGSEEEHPMIFDYCARAAS